MFEKFLGGFGKTLITFGKVWGTCLGCFGEVIWNACSRFGGHVWDTLGAMLGGV